MNRRVGALYPTPFFILTLARKRASPQRGEGDRFNFLPGTRRYLGAFYYRATLATAAFLA